MTREQEQKMEQVWCVSDLPDKCFALQDVLLHLYLIHFSSLAREILSNLQVTQLNLYFLHLFKRHLQVAQS